VENHVISGLLTSVMVVFPACMASLVPLEYQVVTDVMAVTEPKVIRAAQGRLDPRDHRVSWVLLERTVLKENLVSRVPPVKRESVERVGRVDSLGPQVLCLLKTGKSAPGMT